MTPATTTLVEQPVRVILNQFLEFLPLGWLRRGRNPLHHIGRFGRFDWPLPLLVAQGDCPISVLCDSANHYGHRDSSIQRRVIIDHRKYHGHHPAKTHIHNADEEI